MSNIKRICVYCGSRDGNKPVYIESARQLGKSLAENNIELVFGGSQIGMMYALSQEVLVNSGKVIGIIPEALAHRIPNDHQMTEVHVVDTMHTRKQMMFDISDALIAAPGGYGMLDELAEVLCWVNIGFHKKPIGLLNTNQYFDPYVALMQHTIAEGFSPEAPLAGLIKDDNPDTLVQEIMKRL